MSTPSPVRSAGAQYMLFPGPDALPSTFAAAIQGGVAQVLWTADAKNVFALIRASNSDVGSLYKWWLANG
jgi:hypothetical protein